MSGTRPIEWVVCEPEGEFSFRWGYSEGEVIAEWGGILTLRATRSGELKALQAHPGASPDRVEKGRLGFATAFLRAQREQHSLHASAVALQGRGLVCVGASGLGKSTLAHWLCLRPGLELLADDITAIDMLSTSGLHVIPTEPVVWLAAGDSSDKGPVAVSRVARAPARLDLVVCLAFDEGCARPEFRELRGRDAISSLLPSLIRFEKTPKQWASEFDFLDRLVSQCRVARLTRARHAEPEAVADALLGHMSEESR